MNRAALLWLGALVLLVVFLALEPLGSFAIFGSDTGEYYRLTSDLLTTGHLPLLSYQGWGYGYQDFPGTYVVAAAVAASTGSDALAALQVTIPVLGALSVLPLFLLFRRLFPQDLIAILGAGFASVAMPRMFSLAHPAPLALGDLFVVSALWMFLEGRRDVRWYFPLTLTAAALVVTHHLSTYFLLVSVLGGLLLFEVAYPGRWSRRFPVRELVFCGGLASFALAYWMVYARAFDQHVLGPPFDALPAAAVGGLVVAPLVLVALLGLVIRWRRAHRGQPHRGPRVPSDRSLLRDFAILGGGVLAGSSALLLIDVPGTTQSTTAAEILWFVPLMLIVAWASGSRRLLAFHRLGPFDLAWLSAVGLSAAAALISGNSTLSPTRHAEYLLIPLGLLAAISLGRLVARWGDQQGRRGLAAGATAVIVLLAANAAIVYPPQADFGGFQEGLTAQDAAVWLWAGVGLPTSAVVASDHRLSSMVFGFDGNAATWDSTEYLFTGNASQWPLVAAELNGSYAPHGAPRPINVVIVDQTMHAGVALDPSAIATPMSTAAAQWLSGPPFVPVYESGAQVAYWVSGPVS